MKAYGGTPRSARPSLQSAPLQKKEPGVGPRSFILPGNRPLVLL
jgi:hypothetical protein